MEYAGGISRQFGNRAVVRADYSYRKYRDFYTAQIGVFYNDEHALTLGVDPDPDGTPVSPLLGILGHVPSPDTGDQSKSEWHVINTSRATT